jgi:hypothetical protein
MLQTGDQCIRTPEIAEEMKYLAGATDTLANTVGCLVERLSMVMRSAEPPMGAEGGKVNRGVTAPLAVDVRNQRMRVEDTRVILEDVLNRLEL